MPRSFPFSLAVLVLCGCEPSLPQPPYAPQSSDALTAIDSTPPPGRVEHIPPQPAEANAWIDGEWVLRHGRWYWLLGRWVKTPPGARYSPWVVVRSPDATAYYAPSVWKDSHGAVLDAPAGLAFATASGAAVYDAAGNVDNTGRSIKTVPPRHSRTNVAP